jgi:hypothetical protein
MLGRERDGRVGSVRVAKADVVAYRGGEHRAVLRYQRDACAQFCRIEICDRHAVERDPACVAIIETKQ